MAADGACDTSEAHTHVADGTTFEINGIDGLEVADDANISLLFDDFIPDVLGQSDRMDVLDGKARTAAGGAFVTSENVETEFRYMDLVDTTNGNVWVAPANESVVTVFMPYTDSMTAESEIAVVYFDNLTRDYTVDLESADLDEEVATTTAHSLTVTKADGGIVFEVPYREFGPFEIMWMNEAEEPDDPDTPKPPVIDSDEPGKPDPDPAKPDTPDEPDTPEPDDPDEPDEPDTPERDEPDTPDEPDESDTPDTPEPDEPDTPDTPEPGEPNKPEPSEPAKPSNPEATIPQTGDALTIAAALSALAGTGVIGAGVVSRRRRK